MAYNFNIIVVCQGFFGGVFLFVSLVSSMGGVDEQTFKSKFKILSLSLKYKSVTQKVQVTLTTV